MPPKTEQDPYSREDLRRIVGISDRQLRSWQSQGFVRKADVFSFADLIAVRTLQKLRENRIPTLQIGRALASLKKKLSHVESPLSELKVLSDGRAITVQIAGQRMEAITGQMLFDFDTAELNNVRSFVPPVSRVVNEREAELWFQRGLDLEERGAPLEDAVAAYQKAIELNPGAAGALVNLGTIYYHLHRFKESLNYYERAIAVDPRYPLAHFNLGNLCDEWGQLDRANEHYRTALKLNPNYADAHYNMALLNERKGDYLGAARHWKAYLKIDPSSSWAVIARRQLDKIREAAVVRRRPEAGR